MGIAILVPILILLAPPEANGASPSVDWTALIPAIRLALTTESTRNSEFADVEERYSIGISKTADITGDGVAEALVSIGTGGASTDEMTVMRLEDQRPVLAVFMDRDGKKSPMIFVEGGSVMHTDGILLLPQQHGVYAFHYNYGAHGKLSGCSGEGWSWNPRLKTFTYDTKLARKLTRTTCRRVPKSVE